MLHLIKVSEVQSILPFYITVWNTNKGTEKCRWRRADGKDFGSLMVQHWCFPLYRLTPNCGYLSSWGGRYTAWRAKSGKVFDFSIGVPTDELHLFTKISEACWLPWHLPGVTALWHSTVAHRLIEIVPKTILLHLRRKLCPGGPSDLGNYPGRS